MNYCKNYCKVVAFNGKAPIKPSGEIMTRLEYLDLVNSLSSYYKEVTDGEIYDYNFRILYHLYRDYGETHEQSIGRVEKKLGRRR